MSMTKSIERIEKRFSDGGEGGIGTVDLKRG